MNTEYARGRFVLPPATRPTPEDGVIQYSRYELDTSLPAAGACAWVEGAYVPLEDARISILDLGFSRSDTTYTVAMAWHGRLFRLDDHLDRLLAGAEKMRLQSPLPKAQIAAIAKECVARSQLRECFLSITITRGYTGFQEFPPERGATTELYVVARPYRWIFTPEQQISGGTVVLSHTARRPGRNVSDPSIKNYQWNDLNRAQAEAQDRGADSAIVLDTDGWVAEGAGFNILVVKDNTIATPDRNALPGITRNTALEIAQSLGLETELRDIGPEELYDADEIFGATTAGGITPIIQLDGRPVGSGSPGLITTQIRDRFWNLFDEDSDLHEPINYHTAATI